MLHNEAGLFSCFGFQKWNKSWFMIFFVHLNVTCRIKKISNMPDSCLYTIWFENIPCWISLVYYSCYLDHMNAIYWRAFWLNHIFAIHTDCITGLVKSNVWRPPLGHKMQARMDSNAVLWTTGLCSQKKIREKVREQRLVREGLQDNITSFLKFLRGHQRSFLLI